MIQTKRKDVCYGICMKKSRLSFALLFRNVSFHPIGSIHFARPVSHNILFKDVADGFFGRKHEPMEAHPERTELAKPIDSELYPTVCEKESKRIRILPKLVQRILPFLDCSRAAFDPFFFGGFGLPSSGSFCPLPCNLDHSDRFSAALAAIEQIQICPKTQMIWKRLLLFCRSLLSLHTLTPSAGYGRQAR